MSLPAGTRLGSYEILALVGAGGMGEVYRARDTRLHREVALKVLPDALTTDPERRARLEHEARVLATLSHPNVAAIYGLEDSTGRIALVMELVDGVPLRDRIGPRGMPLRDALHLAIQIVAGLEAAHKVGVVHRDLKPGNVIVTSSGALKLLDFGLAKILEPQADGLENDETIAREPTTGAGQIVGTVAYMSPEQAHGARVDTRSDLFSFGTVFYEMLTGRRPFEGPDNISTLAAILRHEPTPPAQVSALPLPHEAERIVLRCLRKDRDRRFQTATDLKLELEDLKDDSTSGALGAHPLTAPASRRWSWTITAVGVGVLGLALAGAYFVTRQSPVRTPMRQLTFEAGVAMTPAISPDGKLLAYASDRSGEGHLDIWLKQVAGGEPVRLTSGPGSKVNPQFSPDGTRLYYLATRNELLEVPALGGSSRRVLESAGPFSVSSRGDIAFYLPGTGTAPGPMFILPAGSNGSSAWHPECVSAGAPVWSPDGLQIAFAGTCREAGSQAAVLDLFVAPRSDGALKRIGTADVQGLNPRLAWYQRETGDDALLITRRFGDSINVYRVDFDGAVESITQSAGFETWPVVSASGDLVLARLEETPSVWSLRLPGDGEQPTREAAPARMFGTSRDGSKLVFGRMLGIERGQLVLRDRTTGVETVLASHSVTLEGKDSFWPQVSPDGRRIVYRANADPAGQYLVSAEGGAPKFLSASADFWVASDWSPDGRRVIGECQVVPRGICELDPDSDKARVLLRDSEGGELLYPSYAWDGRWIAFMLRRSGRTMIAVTPVRRDGGLGGEEEWVRVSPEGADASRPRFSPDGTQVYYELIQGNVVTLVRQRVNAATKTPESSPARLATIETIPAAFFAARTVSVVSITRDRLFFNTVETRSNIWMTKLP